MNRLAGLCQTKLALAATDGKSKKEGRLSPPNPFYYRGTMILTAL